MQYRPITREYKFKKYKFYKPKKYEEISNHSQANSLDVKIIYK
jgi:hypothetical protein